MGHNLRLLAAEAALAAAAFVALGTVVLSVPPQWGWSPMTAPTAHRSWP